MLVTWYRNSLFDKPSHAFNTWIISNSKISFFITYSITKSHQFYISFYILICLTQTHIKWNNVFFAIIILNNRIIIPNQKSKEAAQQQRVKKYEFNKDVNESLIHFNYTHEYFIKIKEVHRKDIKFHSSFSPLKKSLT